MALLPRQVMTKYKNKINKNFISILAQASLLEIVFYKFNLFNTFHFIIIYNNNNNNNNNKIFPYSFKYHGFS